MPITDALGRAAMNVCPIAALLLLAGCIGIQSLQPPTPAQMARVNDGSHALLLARLDCAGQDPEPASGMSLYTSQLPGVPRLEFILGDASSGGRPKWADSRTDFRILSDAARADGWIALIKPPGQYTLFFTTLVHGAVWNRAGWYPGKEPWLSMGDIYDPVGDAEATRRGQPASHIADRRHKPTLRIAVPTGVPVLYAGSIHVNCPSNRVAAQSLVRSVAATVEDQTPSARAVAERELPDLPAPVTRLAVPQTGPFPIDASP